MTVTLISLMLILGLTAISAAVSFTWGWFHKSQPRPPKTPSQTGLSLGQQVFYVAPLKRDKWETFAFETGVGEIIEIRSSCDKKEGLTYQYLIEIKIDGRDIRILTKSENLMTSLEEYYKKFQEDFEREVLNA